MDFKKSSSSLQVDTIFVSKIYFQQFHYYCYHDIVAWYLLIMISIGCVKPILSATMLNRVKLANLAHWMSELHIGRKRGVRGVYWAVTWRGDRYSAN